MPTRPSKPKPKQPTKAELELEIGALRDLLGLVLLTFDRLGKLPAFSPGGAYRPWSGQNITRLRNRITEQLGAT